MIETYLSRLPVLCLKTVLQLCYSKLRLPPWGTNSPHCPCIPGLYFRCRIFWLSSQVSHWRYIYVCFWLWNESVCLACLSLFAETFWTYTDAVYLHILFHLWCNMVFHRVLNTTEGVTWTSIQGQLKVINIDCVYMHKIFSFLHIFRKKAVFMVNEN